MCCIARADPIGSRCFFVNLLYSANAYNEKSVTHLSRLRVYHAAITVAGHPYIAMLRVFSKSCGEGWRGLGPTVTK